MLIGGNIVHDNLESFTLPAGDYAIITIKPKMFFYGELLSVKQNVISILNGFWKTRMKHLIWNMSITQKKQ